MSITSQVDQGFAAFWRRRGGRCRLVGEMGERGAVVHGHKIAEPLPQDESCPLFAKKPDLRPLAERQAAERHRQHQAEYYRLNHPACLARQRAYHQRVKATWTPEQRAARRKYAHDYYLKNRAAIRAKQNALTPEQRAAKAARGKLYYQANKAVIAQKRRDRMARRRAA